MMYLLTKDENITLYLMLYIVDTNYDLHLKDTINYSILTELQIFHSSRYAIGPKNSIVLKTIHIIKNQCLVFTHI